MLAPPPWLYSCQAIFQTHLALCAEALALPDLINEGTGKVASAHPLPLFPKFLALLLCGWYKEGVHLQGSS